MQTDKGKSIAANLNQYKLELQQERRDVKGKIRRCTCIQQAEPLTQRLEEINTELRQLNGEKSLQFVGTPDELKQLEATQQISLMNILPEDGCGCAIVPSGMDTDEQLRKAEQ